MVPACTNVPAGSGLCSYFNINPSPGLPWGPGTAQNHRLPLPHPPLLTPRHPATCRWLHSPGCAVTLSPHCIFNFFPTLGILTFLIFKLEIISYLERSCKNSTENSQISFSAIPPNVNLLSYNSRTLKLTHLKGTIITFKVVQLSPVSEHLHHPPKRNSKPINSHTLLSPTPSVLCSHESTSCLCNFCFKLDL